MKKPFAVAAVAVLAAATLAGCVQVVPDAQTSRALDAIRDRYPQFSTVDDKTIIDASKNACAMFDAGSTWAEYVQLEEASGVHAPDAGVIAGFAFATSCPQHKDVALR